MENLANKELWSDRDYGAFFDVTPGAVSNRIRQMPQHPGRNMPDPIFGKPCFKREDLVKWSREYHYWNKTRTLFSPSRLEAMSPEELAEWGVEAVHFEAAKRWSR